LFQVLFHLFSFDIKIEGEFVSSETIWQNDLSHQAGLEGSNVTDLRVRESQFAAQVFEVRERGDDRKQDRFFGVQLFRNDLGRDRESCLGQGRMI
jgi:hypothetical protein